MEQETLQQLSGGSLQMWVNTAALIVLGILFIFRTWRSQSQEIDNGTISSLRRQVETFDGEMKLYKQQVLDLTQLVGEQKGIIGVQKETIERYEKILQNRNPELTDVLKEIRDFMREVKESHMAVMGELKYQTTVLNKGEERATKLDKVHAEVVGKR